MTHDVIIIIASDNVAKTSCNGFPLSPNFPIVAPRTTLNITNPRTFVPCVNSDVILYSCSETIRFKNIKKSQRKILKQN